MNECQTPAGGKKAPGVRPVVQSKFDVTRSLYRCRGDERPMFEYSLRGNFKIDVVKLAAASLAVAVLGSAIAILSSIGKK